MLNKQEKQRIIEKMQDWERGPLKESLENVGEAKKQFETESSKIPVKRLYTPLDLEDFDYVDKLGFPGSYPFTRGIDPLMYRAKPWVVHKASAFGTPEDTNRRLKALIAKGGKPRFGVVPHLPFQIGYDSDHPLARGEVGKAGVAVDSLWDWEQVYEGIPLDQTSGARIQSNSQSTVGMACYIALVEKKGLKPEQFYVRVQNDVIKEYVSRGTYIFPIEPAVKLSVDVVEYCAKHFPTWTPMELCGTHMRAGGCSAVQEIAFTIANGIAYIDEALRRGLDIDYFAPKLEMFLRTERDFFEEIAKNRAARRMWARLMKERFGAKKPESWALKIMTTVSGHSYTAQQPINNLMRIGLEVLAGALSGAQSIMSMSYDEALGLPSEESAEADLRAQQIIAEERGLTTTIDPLGGSYYLESLTDQIEEEAWKTLKQVDDMGGALAAVKNGFYRKEIDRGSMMIQREIESGERTIIGLNKYKAREEKPIKLFRVDPDAERKHVAKLKKFRTQRDTRKVRKTLAELKEAAKEGVNMMPSTINAVKGYATVGEICDVLRGVFGEYKERA